MNLIVTGIDKVVFNGKITQIDLDTREGFFTLLPRHTDFVAALDVGISRFTAADGNQKHLAAAGGVVVKKGRDVFISTPMAVLSDTAGDLIQTIEVDFKNMREQRRQTALAAARMELGIQKGLQKMSEKEENLYGGI